ncbi:hypothetical protein COW36_05950 [bacterium (Candidatus Blackallbacteria) CG17_big_fil_post_rev_8_21_14_2_50_48_46]|uniref:Cytochrome P460 domain-containing protein n=1 Tax=bacterium (Candidatus Blackallbacteria) CG17_big_fil_post_rev_8_21_14_2_50_48_46 TaxID=2014261 RepID=A0A2M7G899_9BACT|nr:MAG: hypothetical protein COW64_21545 [bacterium (Candidatus Blackallbacteria) CG18_big_fil_WC_8_21_14_2_50_49_26]PIW18309.1 MAG: hypothetical protein COW36_05950 [bacterium (Candidatus Blackallbacteria) CG17_big_fil_post_rev_8_21_14_2_50_48_46]PIW49533.1 MAG: hypothetical protein COW20_05765 [bacterium (Candidatus Blackallbacteria) CG13_big_fil_rev_8_21_14_2_50_49_14]
MLKRLGASLVLMGVFAGALQAKDLPRNAEYWAIHYQSLQLMTPKPHQVDAHISMLCRGIVQKDLERAKAQNGPHAQTSVMIYANPLAEKALKAQARIYPPGSVIIKEKHPHFYQSLPSKEQIPSSIGGMIKREAGYDPENGDWEYFYRTNQGALESGKMQNCSACHSRVKSQDYVFKNWMHTPAPSSK